MIIDKAEWDAQVREETTTGAPILPPYPYTRNRHTVENDAKSALIKRINRRQIKNDCNRKLVVRRGQVNLIRLLTDDFGPAGEVRMANLNLTDWSRTVLVW